MSYVTNTFDDKIVKLLKSGSIGFMPSDTIYGLSCRALDKEAVGRLREIKGRDKDKPFIILISNETDLNQLSIEPEQKPILKKHWPGPLSIIFDAPNSSNWLHLGTNTLAIRMPDNQALLRLIRKCGPLISTSANPDGKTPAGSITEARKYFSDRLDFYVDGGIVSGPSSTIAKLSDGKLETIREGAIKLSKGEKP